jgi:type VI secretion system protein
VSGEVARGLKTSMGKRNSFRHPLLLSVGGFVLLMSLTACPKVPKAVRSRIPGASGQTKLDVKVHVSPTANKNNPVAVDLVLVSDKKLLKELMKMSAKDWFEQRHQVQLDYPKELDLGAGSWEWVPGQAVKLDRLPVRLEVVGGLVFANYFTEGPHRAVINPRKDVLLTLGDDDLCVQAAKEIAKPCPVSKNPISKK